MNDPKVATLGRVCKHRGTIPESFRERGYLWLLGQTPRRSLKVISMNALAEASLDYFITFIFPPEGIDSELAEQIWQSFPEYAKCMNEEERHALSRAARERLVAISDVPDRHGYNQWLHQLEGLQEFLSVVASGEIFQQWDP